MPALASFDYAVVRVVPRVEREEFINAGVILFCRTRRYLGVRIALNPDRLRGFAPWVDPAEVERHLAIIPLICAGDQAGGPIATLPLAGRFHWLISPRSTMIQPSPVHSGLCVDPEATLEHLTQTMVLTPADRAEEP
jgi:hypothetical protein